MTTFLYIAGLAAVLVLIAIVIGIAMCSHFEHFGGDDSDVHPL